MGNSHISEPETTNCLVANDELIIKIVADYHSSDQLILL